MDLVVGLDFHNVGPWIVDYSVGFWLEEGNWVDIAKARRGFALLLSCHVEQCSGCSIVGNRV